MGRSDLISFFFGAAQAVIQLLLPIRFFSVKPRYLYFLIFALLNSAATLISLPLPIGLFLSAASIVLYCRFAFRADWSRAVLYSVLSVEIIWLVFGIFDSLFSIIKGAFNIFDPYIVGIIFLSAGNILSLGAYWIIFTEAHKIIRNERTELQSMPIVIIPLLLILAVEIYIVKVLYNFADTSPASSADVKLLLVQILGTASVFCILLAYRKCADNFRLREKILLYDEQRRYSKQYSDGIKEYYNTAKAMRHDFKNHILIVGELLQKELYSSAANYISKLDKIGDIGEIEFHTGCPIMDIIFTQKLSGLSDKVKINCTAIPRIDETDICTVFANAVDNAVRAVSVLPDEEKFISISTQKRGDILYIEIENSYDGKPFGIGTGLENIIHTAEKYGGTAKVVTVGNKFLLKMILNQRTEDYTVK